MKISICSQVKNRRHQLEKTIKMNAKYLEKTPEMEWVIVDMGSKDGVDELVKDNMCERLHYYRLIGEAPYSIPISKNFAARLSSGDYVFNLDIDNFICDIGDQIKRVGYEGVFCEMWFLGVFGRIGCRKDMFKKVGGYDESFLPAGHHEIDFMNRCRLAGCNFQHIRPGLLAIKNDKEETTRNMQVQMSWSEMNEENERKTRRNAEEGVINPNNKHAKGTFLYNFEKIVELGEEF